MQNFIKILSMVEVKGPDSFVFRILTSAKPRPTRNDIWQYLGQEVVNINEYANVYQIFPTVQEIGPVSFFFSNLDLGKASTNDK